MLLKGNVAGGLRLQKTMQRKFLVKLCVLEVRCGTLEEENRLLSLPRLSLERMIIFFFSSVLTISFV
jgi:hypothetical protein